MKALRHKLIYRLRHPAWQNWARQLYWHLMGMPLPQARGIGKIDVTWPHQIVVGPRVLIENLVSFKVDGPWDSTVRIRIGSDVFIGRNVEFNVTHEVIVGNDVLIAAGCVLVDHDHGTNLEGLKFRDQTVSSAPIVIEDNVWIGANCVVLRGVKIGCNSIIGAGSVVTHDVPPGQIWAGTPARFIRAS